MKPVPAVSASAPGSLAGLGAQGWLQDEESRGSPCSPLAWRILLPGFALAAEHAECWAALLIQNQTETTVVSGLCPGVSSCCRFLSSVTRNEEGTPFPLVQCDGSGFFRCSSLHSCPQPCPRRLWIWQSPVPGELVLFKIKVETHARHSPQSPDKEMGLVRVSCFRQDNQFCANLQNQL